MNDSHSNFSNPILPCGPVYDHAFPPPFYGHPILWDIVCDTNIQVSLLWLHTLCEKQDELPYTLNILDNQAYVCSPICTRFVEDTNDFCSPCAALGPSVAERPFCTTNLVQGGHSRTSANNSRPSVSILKSLNTRSSRLVFNDFMAILLAYHHLVTQRWKVHWQ